MPTAIAKSSRPPLEDEARLESDKDLDAFEQFHLGSGEDCLLGTFKRHKKVQALFLVPFVGSPEVDRILHGKALGEIFLAREEVEPVLRDTDATEEDPQAILSFRCSVCTERMACGENPDAETFPPS